MVRYDLRDSGGSTTADPTAPDYTLRDLAADAAALVDALGGGPAHLAGTGVGGMVAQVAALDHPQAFSALTLVGTRPVAPGPPDADLPDHDRETVGRLSARPAPDWTDRDAVAAHAAAGARILGDDPAAARTVIGTPFCLRDDRRDLLRAVLQRGGQGSERGGPVLAPATSTSRWGRRMAVGQRPARRRCRPPAPAAPGR